ncbi:MAG: hypothetical protein A2494_01865 [Candidatus Lloydbacteria bacterium RIFOXYC12_FULL_46_25]|uniref:histidine kinase n=1 Tax=Candidatus Lloydbacteria bacterium RIFOXYC12_FULL_46_25 TaxID=1798670 RepID=A0A1G2DWM1_9BACT|nr:MAG: hypothetical protein A2494_01865 [Candidatus Lloydbacteria bacterium RIFOXYC12_FULL_46_25]
MPNVIDRAILAKFLEKKEVAPNKYELTFLLDRHMEYKAGQYIWVELPQIRHDDPKGSRRSFSLLTAPSDSKEVSILVEGSESGFKRSLLNLERGSEVNIIGPFGVTFCLPAYDDTPIVLLAKGTGISPCVSLIRCVATERPHHKVTLIYINDTHEQVPFTDEILSLTTADGNRKGVVLDRALEWGDIRDLPHLDRSMFFISGDQAMVDGVTELLITNGVFSHQLQYESIYPTPKESQILKKIYEDSFTNNVNGVIGEDGVLQRNIIFRLAVEESSNHVVITDSNGVVYFANKAALTTTGYTLDEMRGNTPRLWGGLMSRDFYQDFWKKIKSGEQFTSEVVNRRKSGEIYNAILHVSPIFGVNDEIIAYISNEEDVTKLKAAEALLKESDTRLNLALEVSKIGVWDLDIPNDNAVCSQKTDQIFGFDTPRTDWGIKVLMELILPEDRAAAQKTMEIAMETGSYNLQIRVVWPDKSIHWVEAVGHVYYDNEHRPIRMLGTILDITESKKAEEELKRFEAIVLDSDDAIIGATAECVVMNWNDGAERLYGFSAEDMIGRCCEGVLTQGTNDLEKLFARIKNGERVSNHHAVHSRKDGSLVDVSLTISPIKDHAGVVTGVSMIARDITKEKAIDKAKSEFVSLASHQLKTPLSAILWAGDMLVKETATSLNETQHGFLVDLVDSAERMKLLVDQLLNVSRMESGVLRVDPTPVQLEDLIQGVVDHELLTTKTACSISFVKPQDKLPLVPTDEFLLREVISNLIVNAVHYSKPDSCEINVSLERRSSDYLISVSDKGIGIPDDVRHRIFEKLFRAPNAQKRTTDGTGLGLYLVKLIVDSSGGQIWFDSKENVGTSFHVSIPLSGMQPREGDKSLIISQ